jgi:hypothetical protein
LKNYRASSSLSREENWKEIWHLLFRDKPRETNALLDTPIGETIGIIREFWEQKAFQILPADLATRGLGNGLEVDSYHLFMDLLDEIQVGLKQWITEHPDKVVEDDTPYGAKCTGPSFNAESTVCSVNPTSERIEARPESPMAPLSSTTASVISKEEMPLADVEALMFGNPIHFSTPEQEADWPHFPLEYFSSEQLNTLFILETSEST